jgi:hypothetical protein
MSQNNGSRSLLSVFFFSAVASDRTQVNLAYNTAGSQRASRLIGPHHIAKLYGTDRLTDDGARRYDFAKFSHQ